jgi:hypothetical protein
MAMVKARASALAREEGAVRLKRVPSNSEKLLGGAKREREKRFGFNPNPNHLSGRRASVLDRGTSEPRNLREKTRSLRDLTSSKNLVCFSRKF